MTKKQRENKRRSMFIHKVRTLVGHLYGGEQVPEIYIRGFESLVLRPRGYSSIRRVIKKNKLLTAVNRIRFDKTGDAFLYLRPQERAAEKIGTNMVPLRDAPFLNLRVGYKIRKALEGRQWGHIPKGGNVTLGRQLFRVLQRGKKSIIKDFMDVARERVRQLQEYRETDPEQYQIELQQVGLKKGAPITIFRKATGTKSYFSYALQQIQFISDVLWKEHYVEKWADYVDLIKDPDGNEILIYTTASRSEITTDERIITAYKRHKEWS